MRETSAEMSASVQNEIPAGSVSLRLAVKHLILERRDLMNCERSCGNSCSICIAVLVSVVVATIVALLYAFEFIPTITTAIWIVFGFAALDLIFLVVGLYGGGLVRRSLLGKCLCCYGTLVLLATIATLALAIIALSITLATDSIVAIILIALGAFFATVMAIGFISLLVCLIRGMCCWND